MLSEVVLNIIIIIIIISLPLFW